MIIMPFVPPLPSRKVNDPLCVRTVPLRSMIIVPSASIRKMSVPALFSTTNKGDTSDDPPVILTFVSVTPSNKAVPAVGKVIMLG